MSEIADFDELGGWPAVFASLADGEDLSGSMARATMTEVLEGRASDGQLGALLVGLKVKGEAVEEIVGFVDAMQQAAIRLSLPPETVDIVGTGGAPFRRRHALNVSTMASFVAAACGAVVCKHGNRRASSTSGSTDLLEQVGLVVDLDRDELSAMVSETGLGFAFARTFHPAMRFAGPVRSELGIPTVFNLLGPLAHPGRVRRQVVGVATEERAVAMADVLHSRGMDAAWVVTGGGLDELTTTGPSTVYSVGGDEVERFVVDPEAVGLGTATEDGLAGGSPEDNLDIFNNMLAGHRSPQADIVVLNAAAALVVAGLAPDLLSGVERANDALVSGAARAKVDQIRQVSDRLRPEGTQPPGSG